MTLNPQFEFSVMIGVEVAKGLWFITTFSDSSLIDGCEKYQKPKVPAIIKRAVNMIRKA